MDISPDQQSEKDVSLIVHVDDTQSDLEADLMASETDNVKMDTTVNEETNGRIEMEKIIEENAQKETEQTKMKGHVRPKRDQSDIDKPRNHRWNLRITGFTSKTCLDELKRLCSQYGTVLGGSISSKKQKSGVQYRASIGMSQPEEAEKCIAFLNQTKFEGHKIKVEKKRWRHNSLWRKLELSQKQEESLRLFQLGEQLRWEKMKIENLNLSKCEIGRQLLELNFLWTEVLLLNEMRNAMEISNDPRDANKRKFSGGSMRSRMNSPHTPSIFQLPFQNQSWLEGNTHSMHQPQDQSNPDGPTQSKRKRNRRNNSHIPSLFERSFRNQPWLKDTIGFMQNLQDGSSPRKEALSAGPMGSIMRNFPILAALQLLLKSQFRGNEYKNTDYGKQVQSNEMTGRVLEGVSHLDIPEEKQMKKQETFPFPNVQKKVERQIEEKLKQLRELIHSIQKSLNQRKQHDEPNQPSMSNYNNTSRFDLPFQNESRPEEMTHSMKRPRGDKDWNRPRRSRRSSYNNNAPRYEPPFQNESYYNEYGNTDYGRWVGQTERGMTSWEMGPSQDFQGRNDDWSRTDENWIGFDARRDMGRSREPERSYIGPNREQDPDSRNTSSRNRRGQMRSSLGGGSNQRSWDSSSVDRKVDSWSHTYGDIGNSSMNQPNDQWFGNPVNSTGRDTTGAFVDSSKTTNSKGMGYNQRPTNSEGMGYNQKSTNSEGMGYNQRPSNSEGMGYNQRPSNSEGMGYNQGPTNSEGMGYNQGPINSEGMGHNQESTNSEGMGYNQESTNMFDNSQAQDGIMLNIHGGGNNKNGQMQQPYFNAYNTGYQNEGFPSSTVGSQNRLFN
ncbi:SAFB-like transcription modulator [Octopus bimaculoides]|uniref:RRM domain-containing protein n=1 Tax=Octopus bimaculoides TaxID=37653 RepID=A0A0L8G3X1_OCTBM|nr:SAFB-like transcription modulator [Octopus bimaculoides]|eukprot:XP_014784467.1 PREDICTED: GATA zinc finger domain-containing protein 14-like [Octopus bimaculoides]